MKFISYILTDAIVPDLKAPDREGVIREMVRSLADAGGINYEDYEEIVKAFIKREELGSTGIGRGVAFPEIKLQNMNRSVGAVAVSAEGVDFESLEEKVRLFFMTISPSDRPGDHLRIMEHLTRRLGRDETLRESLKHAKTREDIVALLEEDDRKNWLSRAMTASKSGMSRA